MLILAVSDLHVEFAEPEIVFPKADVVILAGDIGTGLSGAKWIRKNFANSAVLYVLGNHEFYGQKYPSLIRKIKEVIKDSNIILLENESVEINGIHFYGATLWTDFMINGDPRISGFECEQVMTDFRRIRIEPKYSKIRYTDLIRIHKTTLRWLGGALDDNKDQVNVVITHHCPSMKSVSPGRSVNHIDAAYASDLEDFILTHKPDVWIHGHKHHSSDYSIGNCRIVCNSYGYPDKKNKDFKNDFIIEL